MNFDISSFNRVAKPLLNKLTEQFPLPLTIKPQSYNEPTFDRELDGPLLEPTLHFLVENKFLTTMEVRAEGYTAYLITEKGLSLLDIDLIREIKKTPSVYEQGKVGC